MITIRQLKIYDKYSGHIDGWVRCGTELEKEYMHDKDWYLIDELMEDLTRIRNGIGADDFRMRICNNLIEYCDSESTIKYLKELEYKLYGQ